MTLLDRICTVAWAIRPEALEAIVALAARSAPSPEWVAERMHHLRSGGPDEVVMTVDGDIEPPYFGAVSAIPGTPIDGAQAAYRRGSVAIVPVIGPIVRYGSMFSSMSGGASSVGATALDFNLALADPDVTAIVLHVDSPGGETNGIAELADMIYDARTQKRIVAYVSDLGASAGYWIASAAHEVIAAETAALGSIGVVAAVRDPSKSGGDEIEIVSGVSPKKRVDVRTKEGRQEIQTLVDRLATVFVSTVARNRDVDPETVTADYGQGGLLVGQDAVDAGLADRLGSFESVIRELDSGRAPTRPAAASPATRPAAAAAPPAPVDPPAGPAASQSRSDEMSLLEDLQALVTRAGGGAVPNGSADQAAAIAASSLPQPTPAPAAGPAPAPQPSHQAQAEADALRTRLAAAESENQSLRLRGLTEAATRWAEATMQTGRAMPAEQSAIAALHVQAGLDDMYQPVRSGPTRVALVEAAFAARQARQDLLSEVLEPHTLAVLLDKARSPKATAAGETPTADRVEELLKMTNLGQQHLARNNGTGAH
jgi:ClpP class serine protease